MSLMQLEGAKADVGAVQQVRSENRNRFPAVDTEKKQLGNLNVMDSVANTAQLLAQRPVSATDLRAVPSAFSSAIGFYVVPPAFALCHWPPRSAIGLYVVPPAFALCRIFTYLYTPTTFITA